jgi:hypothetical protein
MSVIHPRCTHNPYEHVRIPETLLADHRLTWLLRSISSVMISRLMLNLRDPKLAPGSQHTTSIKTTIKFGTRGVVSTFFDFRTQGTGFMDSESEWPRHYHTRTEGNDHEYHRPSRSSGVCAVALWCLLAFTMTGWHIDLDIELVSRNPVDS